MLIFSSDFFLEFLLFALFFSLELAPLLVWLSNGFTPVFNSSIKPLTFLLTTLFNIPEILTAMTFFLPFVLVYLHHWQLHCQLLPVIYFVKEAMSREYCCFRPLLYGKMFAQRSQL